MKAQFLIQFLLHFLMLQQRTRTKTQIVEH
jgi:hypothetical protein